MSKCSIHQGQDLIFQCVEQPCQKPICEICITEEHHQHSTPEIDEFIEGKKRDIFLQTDRFAKYIDKLATLKSRLEESLVVLEANISKETQIRHKYSSKNRPVGIMQELNFLLEIVKKHDDEVLLIKQLSQGIKGEAETFTSLSLITKYFLKCKEFYEVDCRIRALLHALREHELQKIPELSTIIQDLIDRKDQAFYPHLDMEWNTGLDYYNYKYHIVCHSKDGSIIVAGITRRLQCKIIRYNRFGEILWERNQPEKWDQVDDMIGIWDPEKGSRLLCCNIQSHEIFTMNIETGVVEDKFKHESIMPRLLAFCIKNQMLYVFDMTTEPPRICVLDMSSAPLRLLRFFPLPAAYGGSNKILYLSESRLLLVRAYTFKNPCLAAVKEDSGEIVWEYRNEFRGSGVSLSPNGLILTSAINSVLCLNQAGQIIHKYEFQKSAIIIEPIWFQGFLIMLHPVESTLTVKTVMTPCPSVTGDQKVKNSNSSQSAMLPVNSSDKVKD